MHQNQFNQLINAHCVILYSNYRIIENLLRIAILPYLVRRKSLRFFIVYPKFYNAIICFASHWPTVSEIGIVTNNWATCLSARLVNQLSLISTVVSSTIFRRPWNLPKWRQNVNRRWPTFSRSNKLAPTIDCHFSVWWSNRCNDFRNLFYFYK